MSWRDEPATSAQFMTIREHRAHEIGWNNAQAEIDGLKKTGLTRGEASDLIAKSIKAKEQK